MCCAGSAGISPNCEPPSPMDRTFRITGQLLGALSGATGGALVRQLWRAETSWRWLQFRILMENWPAARERDIALEALLDAEARDQPAVHAVVTDPMVTAWTLRTARLLRHGSTMERSGADRRYFHNVATAAARRAGTTAELSPYGEAGWLTLPTMGRVAVRRPHGHAVHLTVSDRQLWLGGELLLPRSRPVASSRWQPLRRLRAGAGEQAIRVVVNDIDRYR